MRYLLSLSLLVLAFIANARQITSDEAQTVAQDFFNNFAIEKSRAPRAVRVRALNTAQSEENAPYYIFNASDNKGFVIISGDDRLPQILGYSKNNVFDFDIFTLQNPSYFRNIEYLSNNPSFSKGSTSQQTSGKAVQPLIKTTWGQGTPYNYLTPILYDGKHCATGCTNTAQAQIMKFWGYPSSGSGIVSYEWNETLLSQDLSTSQYQWDMMLNNYDSGCSEENANAVAVLMRDCGYANHTSYSGESGASLNYSALVRNFGYDKAIRIIDRHICSNQYYEDIMRSELDAGRPFFVGGTSQDVPGESAHEFICDGYDENGYFHFNLGWDGANDGYYLPSIGWKIDNIEIGIQPDCGGNATLTFGSKYDFMYEDGKINCELSIYNPLGIFYDPYGEIYHEVATIAENLSSHEIYAFSKRKGTDSQMIFDMPLPTKLPDGDYIVYPALKFQDSGWNKFTFFDDRQEYISLSVSNGLYTYTNSNISDKLDNGKIEIDGIYYIINDDGTATVTFKNDKYNSYKGSIVIPSTISFNGGIHEVVEIGIDAFRDCTLDKLVIGNKVRVINVGSMSCSMNELIFSQPSSLEEIVGWGFNNCQAPVIQLPKGLKRIGRCAFQNTSAQKIDIPSTVKFMDQGFAFTYCKFLEEVYVHWHNESELPILNSYDHIFDQCNWENMKLYVPYGTASIYSEAPQWKDLNIIEYDESGISDIILDESEQKVTIYNIHGSIVFCGIASNIPNTLKGIYIKQVGNQVSKVVL